jgi:hypothetical protein
VPVHNFRSYLSGKSSLLNAIIEQLKKNNDVIPVLFDAWRYEGSGPIVVPLLHKIYEAVEEIRDDRLRDQLKQILGALLSSITIKAQLVELSLDQFRKEQSADAKLTPLDNAFARPIVEMRRITEALAGRRIAVLIDDLDRCSPRNVVAMLETINLVMDVRGLVFVLALDYDVLIEAVKEQYPHLSSGHAFIEKMVQVPFRVPRLDLERETLLADLIPDWERQKDLLPRAFLECTPDIARLALDANPRQIKRFINGFLVLLRIVQDRGLVAPPELLAALVGLQLGWPEEYQDFADAVYSGDEKLIDSLPGEQDDSRVRQYAMHFFSDLTANEQLRQLVQLTATVAGPVEGSEAVGITDMTSAAERREQSWQAFIAAIEDRGFRRSERSARLYYHPRMGKLRIKRMQTVIRIEEYRPEAPGRDWQLLESYNVTAFENVLKIVDERLARLGRMTKR